MPPNWFTLGMLLTCHLLMARLEHTAVMSFMKSVTPDVKEARVTVVSD